MSDTVLQDRNATTAGRYDRLAGVDRSIAMAANRPRWPAYAAGAAMVAAGWLLLALMASVSARYGQQSTLGPGIDPLAAWISDLVVPFVGPTITGWIVAICTPASYAAPDVQSFLTLVAMWFFMALAMMLPSAAPMLRTYADIADVAAGKGETTVPLYVLAGGYLTVWFIFSVFAASLQAALIALGLSEEAASPVRGWVAATILAAAGLYQFSALKDACLEKCRNPFSILFARWSDRTSRVLRLGLEQGLFCLGCCWALMLVMLVVGSMNVMWMVFLTLLTLLEKSVSGKVTSRVTGGILLAWAGFLAALQLTSAS